MEFENYREPVASSITGFPQSLCRKPQSRAIPGAADFLNGVGAPSRDGVYSQSRQDGVLPILTRMISPMIAVAGLAPMLAPGSGSVPSAKNGRGNAAGVFCAACGNGIQWRRASGTGIPRQHV